MIPIKLNYPVGFEEEFSENTRWFADFIKKYNSGNESSRQLLLMATDEYYKYLEYLGSISSVVVEAFGGCCAYCNSKKIESILPIHPIDKNRNFPGLVQEARNILPFCNTCRNVVQVFDYASELPKFDGRISFEMLMLRRPNVLVPTAQPSHRYINYNNKTGKIDGLTKEAKKTIRSCALNRKDKIDERIDSFQSYSCPYKNESQEKYWYLWVCLKNKIGDFEEHLSFANSLADFDTLLELHPEVINVEKRGVLKELIVPIRVWEEVPLFYSLISFEFENLRNISNGCIDLYEKKSLGLIGENGVGKSTILNFLSSSMRGTRKHILTGASDGFILGGARVARGKLNGDLDGNSFDNEISVIKQDGDLYHCDGKIERKLRIAYVNETRVQEKNIESANNWMLGLAEDNFDTVASQIKSILDVKYDSTLFRQNDKVMIYVDGGEVKELSTWSSGYRSVLSIVYNIYKQFGESYSTSNQVMGFDKIVGVVFIDEIDLHLHPVWKINIIDRLKRVFPDILFIFTTHDPLVLKGCGKGEVLLVSRDKYGNSSITQKLPDISHYNAERILTSRYFGLGSTSSFDNNKDLVDFYDAIKKDDKQSALTKVSALKENGLYGSTYREMIAFMCVDKSLALGEEVDINKIVETINNKVSTND